MTTKELRWAALQYFKGADSPARGFCYPRQIQWFEGRGEALAFTIAKNKLRHTKTYWVVRPMKRGPRK